MILAPINVAVQPLPNGLGLQVAWDFPPGAVTVGWDHVTINVCGPGNPPRIPEIISSGPGVYHVTRLQLNSTYTITVCSWGYEGGTLTGPACAAPVSRTTYQIMSGTITFTTDDIFINGIYLMGDAVSQPEFTEGAYNHQRVSALGLMGERSLSGDPNGMPRVQAFIATKIVLQNEIADRAFEIFQSTSTLDHWLRAERELLGLETAG